MEFTPQFLDEIRSRLSISRQAGGIVQLKKNGATLKGLCPFHKEKTPSFTINDDKGFYHCFGCKAGGDIFDFVMATQGLNFPEAVEKLAYECGLPLPKNNKGAEAQETSKNYFALLEEACKFFEERLTLSSAIHAQDYIRERAIPPLLARKFRLGFAPAGPSLQDHLKSKGFLTKDLLEVGLLSENTERQEMYPKFRNRLIFPIFDKQDRVIAFGGRILGEGQPKYLNSPESAVFHKRKILYGFNFARKALRENHSIIVCEGYMDVIALHKAGYLGAVAPLGTAMGEEQLEELWRSYDDPILCMDGDTAGQQAAIRVAHRALPLLKPGKSLRFVTLPPSEDPDTLLKSGQLSTFQDLMSKALPLSDIIWHSLLQETQPSTPERRALLFKTIENLTATIADANVKISYQQTLKDKFYTAFRNNNVYKINKPLSPLIKAIFNPQMMQRKILLAIVINHPNIIHEIFEDLSSFDLPIAEMNTIRHDIIQWIEVNDNLDAQRLKEHLLAQGHKEILESLLRAELYIHAKFAAPQATDRHALEGWKDIYRRMTLDQRTSQDISLIQQELAQDMNESSWLRLKELKKVSLGDAE